MLSGTNIVDAYLINFKKHQDERGYFARTFCAKTFKEYGLNTNLKQCSLSNNIHCGTLRGMHMQLAPYAECKIVRCVKGTVYDVLLDLRESSKSFGKWQSFLLSEKEGNAIYIPEGVAHGFQTLEDDTTLFYQMTQDYHPECEKRLAWDDPKYNINWPLPVTIMSTIDERL